MGNVFDQFDGAPNPGLAKTAEDTGNVNAGFISMGKGLVNVGRGLGLVDRPEKFEQEAWNALKKKYPKTKRENGYVHVVNPKDITNVKPLKVKQGDK